jgi:hypothetical protein
MATAKYKLPDGSTVGYEVPDGLSEEEVHKLVAPHLARLVGPQEEKSGMVQAFIDSFYDGFNDIVGIPGAIGEGLANLGLSAWDLPNVGEPGSVFKHSAIGPSGLKSAQVKLGLRSDDEEKDRTRSAQIMKKAADVALMGIGFEAAAPSLLAKFAPAAIKSTTGTIGRIANDLRKTYTEAPVKSLIHGTSASIGAGYGAAAAEISSPGDESIGLAGTVAGSLLHPTVLADRLLATPIVAAKDWVMGLLKGDQSGRVAKIYADVIEATGENPEIIIKALQVPNPGGAKITPAAQAGSKALTIVQNFVEKQPKVGGRFIDANEQVVSDAMGKMRKSIDALTKDGRPEALIVAATLRKNAFEADIQNTIRVEQKKAAMASGAIGGKNVESAVSKAEFTGVENAKAKLKVIMGDLWKQMRNDTLDTSSIGPALDLVRKGMREEEALFAENTLRRFITPEIAPAPSYAAFVTNPALIPSKGLTPTATAQELKVARSDLMEKASDLRRQEKRSDARNMDILAASITKIMQDVPGFREANDFSKAFYNEFDKGFVGKMFTETKKGPTMAQGTVLKKALGAGGVQADVNFQQLTRAAMLADKQIAKYNNEISTFVKDVTQNQDTFLRMAAAKLVRQDGTVKGPALEAFMQKNAELLDRFPVLRDQMKNAASATERLRMVKAESRDKVKAFEQSVVGKILGSPEDPVGAVGKVLSNTKTGIADYAKLSELAKAEDAVDGLRTATYQAATKGVTTFSGLKHVLFDGGNKAPMSMMLKNGIMDKQTAKNMQMLLKRSAEIEDNLAKIAVSKTDIPDSATPIAEEFLSLPVKILGVKAGGILSRLLGIGSGGSIMMASFGKRTAENVLSKVPWSKSTEFMETVARDNQLTIDMLSRVKDPHKQRQIAKRLEGALIAAGVIRAEGDEGD